MSEKQNNDRLTRMDLLNERTLIEVLPVIVEWAGLYYHTAISKTALEKIKALEYPVEGTLLRMLFKWKANKQKYYDEKRINKLIIPVTIENIDLKGYLEHNDTSLFHITGNDERVLTILSPEEDLYQLHHAQ